MVNRVIAVLDSSLVISADSGMNMKVIKRAVEQRVSIEEIKEICERYVNAGWYGVSVDYRKGPYRPTYCFFQDSKTYNDTLKKLEEEVAYSLCRDS